MSPKTSRAGGYSREAFKDLDSQPAPAALHQAGVGDLRSILGPRDEPTTPAAVAAPVTRPAVHPAPVTAGRPGSFGTVQSNMRIPVDDADLLKRVRDELDLSTGEVITTAIGELYQAGQLAHHFRPRPEPGALFETRATRLPWKKPADTKYAIVSYRLTPTDFATLDTIQREVGARSRGQLITTAVREWVRSRPAATEGDTE